MRIINKTEQGIMLLLYLLGGSATVETISLGMKRRNRATIYRALCKLELDDFVLSVNNFVKQPSRGRPMTMWSLTKRGKEYASELFELFNKFLDKNSINA